VTGNHPLGVMRTRLRESQTGRVPAARITYVGHATVLIEAGGVRLLTDPVLRSRVAYLRREGPVPEVPAGIDAVLISHLHHDHLDVPSLRLLEGGPRVIAPRGAGPMLRRAGFETDELRPGERVDVEGLRVQAVRAVHGGGRWPLGGVSGEPLGFVVAGPPSIYFAGDTDLYEEMGELAPLDVALVPIAGWGPRLGPGHMDAGRAAQAVALLRPRVAVPIHWGTLHTRTARRGEWFTSPTEEFAAQAAELAPDAEVRVLRPGESTSVTGPAA
jgi:L-ascorbate metabolism protein UlaG (beta-lactamase superfamily)